MNYKKVITAILLVSDGSVNHKYFLENFNISNEDLVNIFDEINNELKEKDYGFYIKYDGKSLSICLKPSIVLNLSKTSIVTSLNLSLFISYSTSGLGNKFLV